MVTYVNYRTICEIRSSFTGQCMLYVSHPAHINWLILTHFNRKVTCKKIEAVLSITSLKKKQAYDITKLCPCPHPFQIRANWPTPHQTALDIRYATGCNTQQLLSSAMWCHVVWRCFHFLRRKLGRHGGSREKREGLEKGHLHCALTSCWRTSIMG